MALIIYILITSIASSAALMKFESWNHSLCFSDIFFWIPFQVCANLTILFNLSFLFYFFSSSCWRLLCSYFVFPAAVLGIPNLEKVNASFPNSAYQRYYMNSTQQDCRFSIQATHIQNAHGLPILINQDMDDKARPVIVQLGD